MITGEPPVHPAADGDGPPPAGRDRRTPFTPSDDRLYVIFHLMGTRGPRHGEAVGRHDRPAHDAGVAALPDIRSRMLTQPPEHATAPEPTEADPSAAQQVRGQIP
ncbi:hypothetical protein QF037_005011 [Streptomyces canus]|nr:hypothetical protein [Streptomyces canus]